MKSNVIASLAILAFILTFTSCSKDDEPTLTGKPALLTSHDWKYSSATSLTADPTYLDGLSGLYANMVVNFKADKTYSGTYVFGALEGTWSFNSGETILTAVGTIDGEFTLITLTETNFDFSFIDDGIFGNGDKITLKFVK